MISAVDDRLVTWASGVAGEAHVVLGPPVTSTDELRIGLYLYSVSYEPPVRTWDRPPHQVWVRYLVTVTAPTAQDEHRVLGELLVTALEDEDLQVESEPWGASEWAAVGSPPMPSFAVSALLRVPRPIEPAKPVLHDLVVQGVATMDLEGLVVGPGDVPLVDVSVELGAGGRAVRTDVHGRFRLCAVPVIDAERELVLSTKGRRVSVTAGADDKKPLIIRIDPPGG